MRRRGHPFGIFRPYVLTVVARSVPDDVSVAAGFDVVWEAVHSSPLAPVLPPLVPGPPGPSILPLGEESDRLVGDAPVSRTACVSDWLAEFPPAARRRWFVRRRGCSRGRRRAIAMGRRRGRPGASLSVRFDAYSIAAGRRFVACGWLRYGGVRTVSAIHPGVIFPIRIPRCAAGGTHCVAGAYRCGATAAGWRTRRTSGDQRPVASECHKIGTA